MPDTSVPICRSFLSTFVLGWFTQALLLEQELWNPPHGLWFLYVTWQTRLPRGCSMQLSRLVQVQLQNNCGCASDCFYSERLWPRGFEVLHAERGDKHTHAKVRVASSLRSLNGKQDNLRENSAQKADDSFWCENVVGWPRPDARRPPSRSIALLLSRTGEGENKTGRNSWVKFKAVS